MGLIDLFAFHRHLHGFEFVTARVGVIHFHFACIVVDDRKYLAISFFLARHRVNAFAGEAYRLVGGIVLAGHCHDSGAHIIHPGRFKLFRRNQPLRFRLIFLLFYRPSSPKAMQPRRGLFFS